MINYNDKIFNCAKRRGYLTEEIMLNPSAYETTFVMCWINKYKNDIKPLDILCDVVGKMVEWSDLTERTLKRFKKKVLELNCLNSAKTIFAKVKSILNDMKNEVELPCMRFNDILQAKKEPTQSIFLTEEEISRIAKVCPRNKEEQYVKCLFLMECFCGARHSDILNLTEDNIVTIGNKKYISYVSIKTRTNTQVPLHKDFLNYMNGYDRKVKMDDYIFNDILRDLCKRADINEPTKIFRHGKWESGEKWEFVTSHVGRKSLCSNLYLRGVDSKTISKLAGHSNQQITENTYIVPMRGLSEEAMSFFN